MKKILYDRSSDWYFRRALFEDIRQTDSLGRVKRRSYGVMTSFIIHGIVIAGGLVASYYASKAAATSDGTKISFIAPPPPPPPPPPGGKKTQKKKVEVKKVPKKDAFVQPKEVPKEVPKKEEKSEPDDGGQEGGVEGGVKGGVVGGVVGGVIGGQLGGQLGGTLTYERVSKPPAQISGDKQPSIPANILPMLRGSKGIILCKIRIGIDGRVEGVEIVRSTIPLLDDVVKKHLANWRFEPVMIGGVPKKIEFLQPFQFNFPG